jgi:hypothetical protein
MDFPAGLPAPLRAGYGYTPVARIQRPEFDAGNFRPRRISADAPHIVGVSWRLTLAQFATFEDWFINDIANGADEFNISLANGLGMNTVAARFEGAYTVDARSGLHWDVSASLRVYAMPVMAANYLEAASSHNPNDIVYGAPVLHTLIHTTLPASYW